ncbi:hypothetical protein BGZ73_001810 [Actinomortierella ambigua]|nr:hypothetical protein BGZ73_001810 [Actinomortierella ambigua]
MYRAKMNPRVWATAQRLRRYTQPAILVSSAVVGASLANARSKSLHCQRGDTLELADPPHRSPSYSQSFSDETSMYRRRPARATAIAYREPEELVPAVLYITAAGFVGAFLARKSNFLIRFVSPAAFALGAAAYTIPRTTNQLLEGLKHYDYRLIGQEAQHKAHHLRESAISAKNAVVGIAEGTVGLAVGGFQAAGFRAREAVHDLEDRSHKLQKKAQHALETVQHQSAAAVTELKDRSDEVVQDLKAKGHELAHDWKNKGQEMATRAQASVEDLKDDAEASAHKAKQWVQDHVDDVQRTLPRDVDSFKQSAQAVGRQAKEDWTQRYRRAERGMRGAREDVELGWDRLRSRVEDDVDELSEAFSAGEEEEQEGDDVKARGRVHYRPWAAAVEEYSWLPRDQQQQQQQPAWYRAREGHEQYRQRHVDDAEDVDAIVDWEAPSRRQDNRRGRPSSPTPSYSVDEEIYEYDIPGRSRSSVRRPSVSELAREEGQQSWARAKRYQQQDRAPSPARQWWNTHARRSGEPLSFPASPASLSSPATSVSPPMESSRQWEDSLEQAKDRARKKMEGFRIDVDRKMQDGRRWWQEQAGDLKRRGMEEMENIEGYGRKLGDRMRERFEYHGRDVDDLDAGGAMGAGKLAGGRYDKGNQEFQYRTHQYGYYPVGVGGQYPQSQQHSNPHGSVYSNDNWFHYEPSASQRRGERGI